MTPSSLPQQKPHLSLRTALGPLRATWRKCLLAVGIALQLSTAAQAAPALRSEAALVLDLQSAQVLFEKGGNQARPIASITKLMTALVVAESGQSMESIIKISDNDVDRLRYSRSRLSVGTTLSRTDMLHLALMSSENRAAHALARYHPGGMPAFVRAMNDKARALGMRDTHFIDPTGLSEQNVSTPKDLVKLLRAIAVQPALRKLSISDAYQVSLPNGRQLNYNNTNRLVKNDSWHIKVSKTGFINEAGQCLVMVANVDGRDLAFVLLNADGYASRFGDAARLRQFFEKSDLIASL